jgi:LDH2 family malate/lactate/ureidoglycolate dehydrogenase
VSGVVAARRESGVHLSLDALRALAENVLQRAGLSAGHAEAVAETIVAVRKGIVTPDPKPRVEEPAPALVRVRGDFGFAQLAFAAGRPHLIRKASSQGIAALALNDVVHFAALWPEVEALAEEGLVALAMTPSHAWVAPAGGTRPVFGTNPIAFGWPRPDRAPFVFDFATSAVARGEIELHHRAGQPVPEDWGYDEEGRSTTSADAVLRGAMRTFGGHKGSALAAMVELLAGPLIGDFTSRQSIEADAGRGGSPIGGELIVAIDPAGFLGDAVSDYLRQAEAMFEAIEGQGARLPSTRRYAARAQSLKHGVVIPAALHADIQQLLETR